MLLMFTSMHFNLLLFLSLFCRDDFFRRFIRLDLYVFICITLWLYYYLCGEEKSLNKQTFLPFVRFFEFELLERNDFFSMHFSMLISFRFVALFNSSIHQTDKNEREKIIQINQVVIFKNYKFINLTAKEGRKNNFCSIVLYA